VDEEKCIVLQDYFKIRSILKIIFNTSGSRLYICG